MELDFSIWGVAAPMAMVKLSSIFDALARGFVMFSTASNGSCTLPP